MVTSYFFVKLDEEWVAFASPEQALLKFVQTTSTREPHTESILPAAFVFTFIHLHPILGYFRYFQTNYEQTETCESLSNKN